MKFNRLIPILMLVVTSALAHVSYAQPCDCNTTEKSGQAAKISINGLLMSTAKRLPAGLTEIIVCTYTDSLGSNCVSCCNDTVTVDADNKMYGRITQADVDPGIVFGDTIHPWTELFLGITIAGEQLMPLIPISTGMRATSSKGVWGHGVTDWGEHLVTDIRLGSATGAIYMGAFDTATTFSLQPSYEPGVSQSKGLIARTTSTSSQLSLLSHNGSGGDQVVALLSSASRGTMFLRDFSGGPIPDSATFRGGYVRFDSPDASMDIGVNGISYSHSGGGSFDVSTGGVAEMSGFKMSTGASSGYVLTSDGTGSGTWQTAGGGGSGGGPVLVNPFGDTIAGFVADSVFENVTLLVGGNGADGGIVVLDSVGDTLVGFDTGTVEFHTPIEISRDPSGWDAMVSISSTSIVMVDTLGDTVVNLDTGDADFKGPLSIGGNGTDGHLTIVDAAGDTLVNYDINEADLQGPLSIGGNGTEGHLTIVNAAGDTTTTLNTTNVEFKGPVAIGGGGHNGGLAILAGGGDTVAVFQAGGADFIAGEVGFTGPIVVGGDGYDGNLVIVNAAGDTLVSYDTNLADFRSPVSIGGNGTTGSLVILDSLGDTLVSYDTNDADFRGPLSIGGGGTDGHLTIVNAAGDTTTSLNTADVAFKGPVGIGTSTPLSQLQVVADTGTDYGGASGFNEVVAGFKQSSGSWHSAISIDAANGQDAVAYLAESGSAMWGIRHDASAANKFQIRWHGFGANSTKLTIDTNGYVGIDVQSPTEKLHVSGNICYTGSIGACSDARYKKDVTTLSNSLSQLLQLRGIRYNWKQKQYPDQDFDAERHLGFIAQEVEQLYPEMVLTDDNGFKSVDYGRLTPVLVEAIKEQQKAIESQGARIESQQLQIDELKSLVNKLVSGTLTNATFSKK